MDIFESKYTAEDLENALGAVLAPFEEGRKTEREHFWDIFQDYGRRTSYTQYTGAFLGSAWTDENFNPKYPMVPTDASYMFRGTGITDLTKEGVVLDFSQCTKFNYAFAYNSIEKLPFIDVSKAVDTTEMFNNIDCESMHLKFSENTPLHDGIFWQCSYLVNLRIEGTIAKSVPLQHSDKLSIESVQSVIDHLKDLTGQATQTFTVHKTVGNNMTATQKAEITAKNWTLVY